LQFRIGIFHTFTHQYSCQVVYSPRFSLGIGLSDGEGNERIWSVIRHVIPALRVTSPSRRIQTLGILLLFVGEEKHMGLAVSFNALFKSAFEKIKESRKELDAFYSRTNISGEELVCEGHLMLSYFRNLKEIASSDVADDICELIYGIMEMENFDAKYKGLPPSSIKTHKYMEMKQWIARRTAGRIAQGIDITKDVINAKLIGLLASCNQTLDL